MSVNKPPLKRLGIPNYHKLIGAWLFACLHFIIKLFDYQSDVLLIGNTEIVYIDRKKERE